MKNDRLTVYTVDGRNPAPDRWFIPFYRVSTIQGDGYEVPTDNRHSFQSMGWFMEVPTFETSRCLQLVTV